MLTASSSSVMKRETIFSTDRLGLEAALWQARARHSLPIGTGESHVCVPGTARVADPA